MGNLGILKSINDSDVRVLPNGLIKALLINTNIGRSELVDRFTEILESGDVSNLKFGNIDLSNDIKSIGELSEVLFCDGVVWREYKDSYNTNAGILFANGRYFSNFRDYGFQLSGDRNGDGDYGSFYSHTFDMIGSVDYPTKYKVELMKAYAHSIACVEVWHFTEEIDKFVEWFVTSFLDLGLDRVKVAKLEYSRVKLGMRLYSKDTEVLPKGFNWELDKCTEHYNHYSVSLDISVDGGILCIGGRQVLSSGATKLFLSVGNQMTQLAILISGIVNDDRVTIDIV